MNAPAGHGNKLTYKHVQKWREQCSNRTLQLIAGFRAPVLPHCAAMLISMACERTANLRYKFAYVQLAYPTLAESHQEL